MAVRHGDSFIQWVEWEPGARRLALDPALRRGDQPAEQSYFTDQATLFVQHRLKPVHFWREDARPCRIAKR